ncbi:Uncharacterized protein FWK35_00025930 [Aphis craccivora]|uniref:Uncharacterized protein n=1 Tax=Aphis craccivora TaxID=307492 RepID=A0A6G0Z0F9_APHCR|nr:Uncharacterized protein FWK35_00025930 [Aphis craccivora]
MNLKGYQILMYRVLYYILSNLSSVETAELDIITLLTPTKIYVKSRNDAVELVFPSLSSVTSTPQKNKIFRLIDMPSPSLKRKINYEIENDSPRKVKLKQSIKQKFPSCNSRALVTMQFKNKRQPWTKEEKNLSLNLFYKSLTANKINTQMIKNDLIDGWLNLNL